MVVLDERSRLLLARVAVLRGTRPHDRCLFLAFILPAHIDLIGAALAAFTTLLHDLLMVTMLWHVIVTDASRALVCQGTYLTLLGVIIG